MSVVGRPRTLSRSFNSQVRGQTGKQAGGEALTSWAEADAALADLGRLDEEATAAEEQYRRAMAEAEAEAARTRAALKEQRERLLRLLEDFCRCHESELARRSRRLLFGRVGFRTAPAVVVRDESAAVASLVGCLQAERFLRVRRELDREALRAFLLRAQNGNGRLRHRLKRAGIRLELRDHWFYSINEAALSLWGDSKPAARRK